MTIYILYFYYIIDWKITADRTIVGFTHWFCLLIEYNNVGSTFSIARCTWKDSMYAFYIPNGAKYEYIY